MPSSIQLIAKLIHETIGIVVRFDHTGSSFKGQNKAPGSIMRVSGGVKPREGCQIIFEIATIPAEEKLLTAPILQAIFAGPFPGVFTVKPTTHGSTIYYRLQYPLTSLALNATLQIVKDLEQVRGVGEEIRRYLPVKPLSSDVKGLFEGLNMARYISPLSDDLQEKVRSLIPGDSFLILDALLGQRILFLECDHFYQRNLALSWIAGELKHWDLT
ncbi:MAG: hypothetical protein HKN76_15470, partial [Saprospiraceae bacterium]|nr:hypothetical protein [Saprospiraceae bacterium]